MAPAAGPQADGHRRVEVAAGDVADRIGHGQHGEPESQGDTDEADPDVRERGGEDGATATAEDQPESAEKLGAELLSKGHLSLQESVAKIRGNRATTGRAALLITGND
jgi:hypothetical protein